MLTTTGRGINTTQRLGRSPRGGWIFKSEVKNYNEMAGMPPSLCNVVVADEANDEPLSSPTAVALVDPKKTVVYGKILDLDPYCVFDQRFIVHLLERALRRRERFFSSDVAGNSVSYRLFHGESDGIPGLYIDKFVGSPCPVVVMRLSSVGLEGHLLSFMKAVEKVHCAEPSTALFVQAENGGGKRSAYREAFYLIGARTGQLYGVWYQPWRPPREAYPSWTCIATAAPMLCSYIQFIRNLSCDENGIRKGVVQFVSRPVGHPCSPACQMENSVEEYLHGLAGNHAGLTVHQYGDRLSSREVPMIAANHVSYLDIYVLESCGATPLSFVAKRAVGDMFLIGQLARAFDCVFVSRSKCPKERGDVVAEIERKQKREHYKFHHYHRPQPSLGVITGSTVFQLCIFPEGTTTNGRSIIRFRKGAFEGSFPVQPVKLAYSSPHCAYTCLDLLYHILIFLSLACTEDIRCDVYWLPKVEASEASASTGVDLANATRLSIAHEKCGPQLSLDDEATLEGHCEITDFLLGVDTSRSTPAVPRRHTK
ncbi:hypothetical protein Pmar_PMAR005542 [Perkinsus marinus ATCC 50983]|uniref:Phospholipid/glycerol acyltransferase domain-containing protein n=1 Tax=Perkinsus marinus (strain ATCC 50983 / TXsc) TaxID=423536 RepID=C5KN98_PERM5|nr:hypothetical protein Pmar_PMAR005542 [Perkinsus marinus ATCC 50983]EER14052.1 hypothetical protein Pmar_PMAR005542 [Perkinsus marinus ATCC 50983]|eukprot:XP_002782257.1 hypothetical protein Pmar_PMAR005542 [Perkinsus marinus ATCC 50983]